MYDYLKQKLQNFLMRFSVYVNVYRQMACCSLCGCRQTWPSDWTTITYLIGWLSYSVMQFCLIVSFG